MQKRLLSNLIWLAIVLGGANASLYPTRPIANTVLKAGEVQTIKWKDSDGKPSLENTPRLRMDLYVANDRFLTTLAEGVNPLDLYHNVTIVPSLWSDASNFHIRFYSQKPEMIIYTADFTVTGMEGKNITNGTEGVSGAPGSVSGSSGGVSPTDTGFGLQGGNSNNVSTVTATSTMGSGSSDPTTLSTSFQSGSSHSNGEAAAGRRFSAERGLVKYVYVLWPALIGVALAL